MKKYVFYTLLLLALTAMFMNGGCSKETPNQPDENLELIDQEFGGFNAADETPDAVLVQDFNLEDEDVTDGISDSPELRAAIDSPLVNVYFVRVTWGKLQWDSTMTVTTDWSGSATVSKGALLVLKKIRFEPNDGILPRTDRTKVEWVSYTMPHFDGLAFAIVDRDTAKNPVDGQFTLNFTNIPKTYTFAFSELDSLEILETIDDNGNQISINAYNKKVVPFAGGFLDGRWVRDKKHGGTFWGRWVNNLGVKMGYLKGIWGVDRFGKKVFYGKITDNHGRFQGLIRGVWDFIDENRGHGFFHGNWVNANLSSVGTLKGQWMTGKEGDGKGHFKGRWHRKF